MKQFIDIDKQLFANFIVSLQISYLLKFRKQTYYDYF